MRKTRSSSKAGCRGTRGSVKETRAPSKGRASSATGTLREGQESSAGLNDTILRRPSTNNSGSGRPWSISSAPSLRKASYASCPAPTATSLRGHDGAICCVTWSPIEAKLASADNFGRVLLWQASGGPPFRGLSAHTDTVRSVAWSPSGQRLATSDTEGRVVLWCVDTSLPEGFRILRVLRRHTGWVNLVFFRGEGRLWSVGGDSRILVWNVAGDEPETFGVLSEFREHAGQVTCAALTEKWVKGPRMLTAGADERVALWNVSGTNSSGYKVIREVADFRRGHTEVVRAVAWSATGRRFATGAEDEKVILWEMVFEEPYFKLVSRLKGHSEAVLALAFCPEGGDTGERLASAGEDTVVRIWSVNGDESSAHHVLMELRGHHDAINTLIWSPDGQQVVTGAQDRRLLMWATPGLDVGGYKLCKEFRSDRFEGVASRGRGRPRAKSHASTTKLPPLVDDPIDALPSDTEPPMEPPSLTLDKFEEEDAPSDEREFVGKGESVLPAVKLKAVARIKSASRK